MADYYSGGPRERGYEQSHNRRREDDSYSNGSRYPEESRRHYDNQREPGYYGRRESFDGGRDSNYYSRGDNRYRFEEFHDDHHRGRDNKNDRRRHQQQQQPPKQHQTANSSSYYVAEQPKDENLPPNIPKDPRGEDPTKRITKKASSRGAGRNTESFDPASTLVRPDIRVLVGNPNAPKFDKPIKHDDVIVVPELFGPEDNWEIYYELVKGKVVLWLFVGSSIGASEPSTHPYMDLTPHLA